MVCLELAGGPTNVKDLNRMYQVQKTFDSKSGEARSVARVLSVLNEVFLEKTPELERFNVITLYCVIAELLKQYVIDDVKPNLHEWFIGFETKRGWKKRNLRTKLIPSG